MTTDPQLLRSEAFADIGLVVQRDSSIILERWCRRAVLEQPEAKRVHHQELRDGLGVLLRELGRSLAECVDDGSKPHALAGEHGQQRWNSGWSLPELVRDYQILRLVMLEYLEETVDRPLELREIMAVGLALDEAIAASVGMYVAYRDDATRQAERQRTEAERRSTEELTQWQRVFEHAGWGVTIIEGESCKLTALNAAFARMHGYETDELRARSYLDLVAADARSETARRFAPGVGEDTCSFESTHVRRDGSCFPVLTVITAFRDARGDVLYHAANCQDITARKELEHSLAEKARMLVDADHRKDRFLAMLAHELRNPLSAIQNAVESMRLDTADHEGLETALAVSDRQLQLLVRLVDDLLDVARVSQGKFELRRERIDLLDVMAAAVEGSRAMFDTKSHELSVELPAEPIFLEADPARLQQVLTNLLNNAAKYTDAGGEVLIAAECSDREAVVRVRDTGIGIEPELLPYVFELFRQSDDSAQRTHGGLGVGLTLVRSLVEMHGGTVSAASPGAGKGSEFIVRLPVAGKLAVGEGAMSDVKPQTTHNSHARILLVDDNKDVVSMLAILLRRVGHEVLMAHDGPAAIEVAERERPEVILLDIGLPGMDGYAVAERLRSAPDLSHLFLVAMTGYGQEDDLRRAEQAGFHHHLLKPVRLESIQAALELWRTKRDAK